VDPKDRPISPHVTIYKQPLEAISSIANRIAGVSLSVGVFGIALLGLTGNCDIPCYVESFQNAAPILVPPAKLLVGGTLAYHYLAGLRHLYWDYTAKGLELPTTKLSSQVLIGTSAVAALALAIYTIGPNEKRRKKLHKSKE